LEDEPGRGHVNDFDRDALRAVVEAKPDLTERELAERLNSLQNMSQASAPDLQVTATDRVALVTGAARGIGRAIALRLAGDGFHVAVNDLSKMSDELEKVKSEIESRYGDNKSCIIFADVSKQNEVREMINKTVQELGRLDVMVANAGILWSGPFLGATEEDFDRIMNVNAKSVFFCYQEAAKQVIVFFLPL
ncbi:unnamed protein product, partial [Didymodactylos carnosus]